MGAGTAFCLGVLMLDNGFPRPPGDIGNAETFPFRVIYERVPGARVEMVVTGNGLSPELLSAFVSRARSLERQGCDLITTGCGFLFPHQHDISAAVGVPVVTSSLCLLSYLSSVCPPSRPIGVLTYDGPKLAATLRGRSECAVEIEGIETGAELYRVIAEDRDALDIAAAREDVRAASLRLAKKAPGLRAVVLECTNLPPYRDVVDATFDCPVYDIRDLVHWHAGLARPQ